MVLTAIRVACERGVTCVVTPYEADAQLGYLCKNCIHGVISEDSDLLVYGCKLLIAKLDATGRCDAVKLRDVFMSSSSCR